LRSLVITTLACSYILCIRPIHGIGALNLDMPWSRNVADASFFDHCFGMAIGWSMNPLVEKLFMKVFTHPYESLTFSLHRMQVCATVVYVMVIIPLALLLYRCFLHNPPSSTSTQQVKSSTDAGYDDGGGDAGGD